MNRILKIKGRHVTRKLLLMAIVVGLGLPSCTYYTNEFVDIQVPQDLSFDGDIIPMFESSCNNAGCHSGTIPPDLRAESAYDELIDGEYVTDFTTAENNLLYQKIADGGSMEAFASDTLRAYIKAWIEDGAQNN